MSAASFLLTVSASYRSGSEVLLADSSPLPDLAAVREALSEIDLVLSLQPTYPAAERLRTQIRAALGT